MTPVPLPRTTPCPAWACTLHPADELYLVRQQLRWLRARETALTDRLRTATDRDGSDWSARVTTTTAQPIDESRLPLSIRADPRLRRTQCVTRVELHPAELPERQGAGRPTGDAMPGPADPHAPFMVRTGNSVVPSAAPRPAGR